MFNYDAHAYKTSMLILKLIRCPSEWLQGPMSTAVGITLILMLIKIDLTALHTCIYICIVA